MENKNGLKNLSKIKTGFNKIAFYSFAVLFTVFLYLELINPGYFVDTGMDEVKNLFRDPTGFFEVNKFEDSSGITLQGNPENKRKIVEAEGSVAGQSSKAGLSPFDSANGGTGILQSQALGRHIVKSHNLGTGSVNSRIIKDYSIESRDIDTDSINSRTIKDESIQSRDLQDNIRIRGYFTVEDTAYFHNNLEITNDLSSSTASITTLDGTTLTYADINLNTLDFGINTITDGNLTGDWDFNSATITGITGITGGTGNFTTLNGTTLTYTIGNLTTANITTVDLGTNTIADGNFNGNWNYNNGIFTNINSLTATTGNITTANIATADFGINTITDENLTGNWDFNTGAISGTGTILPAADLTYNLGSPGLRWANVYAGTLNIGGVNVSDQAIFTYQPVTTAITQSSAYINPLAAIADAPLLGIAVNNSEKLRIDEDGDLTTTGNLTINGTVNNYFAGNVGIGTSPSYRLDISDSTTTRGLNIVNSAASSYGVYALGTSYGVYGSDGTTSGYMGYNDTYGLYTANNAYVGGTLTLGSALTINGNILPSADNTYDLGSTAYRWKTLHVGPGSIVVHNDAMNTLKATLGFSGSTAQLSTDAATPLQITTGANTGINITTGGNVGIGTTTPSDKLEVAGNIRIKSDSEAYRVQITTDTIQFYDTMAWLKNSYRNDYIQLGLGSSSGIAIMPNGGNVGIGTTSPGAKLQLHFSAGSITGMAVDTSSTNTGFYSDNGSINLFNSSATSNNFNMIMFSGNRGIGIPYAGIAGVYTDHANTLGELVFLTAQGAGLSNWQERMRITSSGNVGIGTTTPGFKLDILGSANPDGLRITGLTPILRLDSTYNVAANRNWAIVGAAITGGDLSFIQSNAKDGDPHTGTTRLYIQNSGNVGIGTTGPSGALHIYRSAAGTQDMLILENKYDGLNGNIKFLSDDSGGIARAGFIAWNPLVSNNGRFDIYADGGTTPTLAITSSNVGIGTAAPGAKLHVDGGDSSGIIRASYGTISTQLLSSSIQGKGGVGTFSNHAFDIYTNSTVVGMVSATGGFSWGSGYVGTDAGAGDMIISGNVGIGTTAPGALLDVSGNIITNGNIFMTSATARLYVGATAGYGVINRGQTAGGTATPLYIGESADTGKTIFRGSGATTIEGNVGIGTVSPNARLSLGTGVGNKFWLYDDGGAWRTGIGVDVGGNGSALSLVSGAGTGGLGQGGVIEFLKPNSDYSAYSTMMLIDKSGNIGIGTTNPPAQLSLTGTFYSSAASTVASGTPIIGFGGNGPSRYVTMGFGYQATPLVKPPVEIGYYEENNNSNTYGSFIVATRPDGSLTAATERFRITSSGSVGIGTTNPEYLLSLYHATIPQLELKNGTRSFVLTNNSSDSLLSFSYGGANRLQFDTSNQWFNTGNVGIGTTAPGAKLTVAGTSDATIRISGSVNPSLQIYSSRNWAIGDFANAYTTEGLYFKDDTGNAVRMIIDSSGNVGIGTTGPGSPLDIYVSSSTQSDPIITLGKSYSTSPGVIGGIAFRPYWAGAGPGFVDAAKINFADYAGYGGAILFYTKLNNGVAASASLERMRIDTTGNVGIGTTSPGNRLSIISSATNVAGLLVTGGSSVGAARANDGQILLGGEAAAQGLLSYEDAGSANLYIDNSWNNDQGNIYLRTKTSGTPVNAVTILGNGNVGIGTTGPAAPFHLAANSPTDSALAIIQSAKSGNPVAFLGFRASRGTIASPSAVQTDDMLGGFNAKGYMATALSAGVGGVFVRASQNFTDSANGTYLAFHVTANGATADSEKVRIDNQGDVGIGTTNPGIRLTVNSGASQQIAGFFSSHANYNEMYLGTSAATNDSMVMGFRPDNDFGYFGIYGDDIVSAGKGIIIKSGGLVGIGTTNPEVTFNVDSTNADTYIKLGGGAAGSGAWYLDSGGTGSVNAPVGGFSIYAWGAPRLSINSGGNIGIGTTGPGALLQVGDTTTSGQRQIFITDSAQGLRLYGGSSNAVIQSSGTVGFLEFKSGNNNDQKYVFSSSGNVGIGTTSPDQKLDVIGTIQASNLLGGALNITTDANGNIIRDPSDVRLKENIQPITNALEKVLGLRGVTYNWKDKKAMGPQRDYGLIAQEVAAVVPELTTTSADGIMGVKYTNMVGLLVNAVQEQQTEINYQGTAISNQQLKITETAQSTSELQTAVNNKLNIISDSLTALDSRITKDETDISSSKTQLEAANAKLKEDENNLATFENSTNDTLASMLETENMLTERILSHEDRIKALENQIATITVSGTEPPSNIITTDKDGNAALKGIFTADGIETKSIETEGIVAGEADFKSLKLEKVKLKKYSSPPFECDSDHDGEISVTSTYRTCICNPDDGWVFTSDGTTACAWH